MYDPPPGYADMEGDAHTAPYSQQFDDLNVDGVGVVKARRPMPNAVHNLSMAANSDLDTSTRVDYVVLFVRNHLAPGELERMYHGMITGDTPADSIERIARAVATWGTARPTSPSSPSR
jgi:hypothetical protein